MSPLLQLPNALSIFDERNTFYGVLGGLGLVPLKDIPWAVTDNDLLLDDLMQRIDLGEGPWILCTRRILRQAGFFQKSIQAVTDSIWQHNALLIGKYWGKRARMANPDLLDKRESPRWVRSSWQPKVMIGGIDKIPMPFECIESQMYVATKSLKKMIKPGDQVIAFTNPHWTDEQRLKIVLEAYSWYGEPYDVLEIARRIFPWVPNSKRQKVCSTQLATWVSAGDYTMHAWARRHGLNPEYLAPRDIFNYCVDTGAYGNTDINCSLEDALKA